MRPARRDLVVALVVALVVGMLGCGGKPAPKRPDPKSIAAALDADLRQLHAIATRLEGKCDPLVAELQPHVAKMRVHVDEAKQAMSDPEIAPALKREVRAFGQQHAALGDATGESLAKSFIACNQDARLEAIVRDIPEL